MRFAIVNIHRRNNNGTIDGAILVNKIVNTFDEAILYAKKTSLMNSNQRIAVTEESVFNWMDGEISGLRPLAIV